MNLTPKRKALLLAAGLLALPIVLMLVSLATAPTPKPGPRCGLSDLYHVAPMMFGIPFFILAFLVTLIAGAFGKEQKWLGILTFNTGMAILQAVLLLVLFAGPRWL